MLFEGMLSRRTVGDSNFSDMRQVFKEIQKQSASEARCLAFFQQRKRLQGRLGYTFLGDRDSTRLSRDFDRETVIATARSMADELAEESGWLGLVGYCEPSEDTELVQFRLRRSRRYKRFDVRRVLELFALTDGGGHEGAIGFRLPRKEIPDLSDFVGNLVRGIDEAAQGS